jgi:hypothetical protein
MRQKSRIMKNPELLKKKTARLKADIRRSKDVHAGRGTADTAGPAA